MDDGNKIFFRTVTHMARVRVRQIPEVNTGGNTGLGVAIFGVVHREAIAALVDRCFSFCRRRGFHFIRLFLFRI